MAPPPPQASCLFKKSCDPVISRHVCDEISPLKILKAPVELADFQGRSVRVETGKAERGETLIKNKTKFNLIRSCQVTRNEFRKKGTLFYILRYCIEHNSISSNIPQTI